MLVQPPAGAGDDARPRRRASTNVWIADSSVAALPLCHGASLTRKYLEG